MPEYVKLADDPTFYYVDEEQGVCEKMHSHTDVEVRGLYAVRTVTPAELEALLTATSAGEAGEEEE